jgi:hypothetical protein
MSFKSFLLIGALFALIKSVLSNFGDDSEYLNPSPPATNNWD